MTCGRLLGQVSQNEQSLPLRIATTTIQMELLKLNVHLPMFVMIARHIESKFAAPLHQAHMNVKCQRFSLKQEVFMKQLRQRLVSQKVQQALG